MQDKIYKSKYTNKKVRIDIEGGVNLLIEELDPPRENNLITVNKKWFLEHYEEVKDAKNK